MIVYLSDVMILILIVGENQSWPKVKFIMKDKVGSSVLCTP